MKKIFCVLVLASSLQLSWGFALLGPVGLNDESWQIPYIAYGLAAYSQSGLPGGPVSLGDIGAPKQIGQGYRRNQPVLYYAYDANFINFFQLTGTYKADEAFGIMNSITNVDSYSSGLTEFPLQSQYPNYTAEALYLTDLKSVTLHLLVEQLGLADPQRYAWALVVDFLPPGGTCPADNIYLLTQRNYDFAGYPNGSYPASVYVNNVLYTYYIVEICSGAPDPRAWTVPFPVDPLAAPFNAVAQNTFWLNGGLQIGNFYAGLSRDDVAGLRYLYSTNNIALEASGLGSVLESTSQGGSGTNYGQPYPVFTSDLTALVESAQTNSPTTLSNLYPGLIVTSSTANYALVATTTYVSYYTNLIGAPAGSQSLVTVPVVTYNFTTNYVNTFANVVTNTYNFHSNATAYLLTQQAAPLEGAPYPSPLHTNSTFTATTLTGIPSGTFYINTNVCGPNLVLSNFALASVATTNLITAATNSTGQFYSQSQVTYSNSSVLIVQPIICGAAAASGTTNVSSLYRGISGVKFVRHDYDSFIGQYWSPVTNTYTMVSITNSQQYLRTFQRVVTQPDVLLTASDDVGANTFNGTVVRTDLNFDTQNVPGNAAGPGVINSTTTISYNELGVAFWNGPRGSTNGFLTTVNETTQIPSVAWASFDGTTNAPIIYGVDSTTNLALLQNLILVQITPTTLPNGTKNAVYPSTTFTATGGAFSPPFTWSLASGSGVLPPGLTLSSGGTISGTPTLAGTYDFVIQLTDSLARTVQWNYSITIQ